MIIIYASFCFNFPQNVLGSRSSSPDPAEGRGYSAHQTQRSATDKNVGGAGGGVTSASAFSLGHRRKNPKKVENPCVGLSVSLL